MAFASIWRLCSAVSRLYQTVRILTTGSQQINKDNPPANGADACADHVMHAI